MRFRVLDADRLQPIRLVERRGDHTVRAHLRLRRDGLVDDLGRNDVRFARRCRGGARALRRRLSPRRRGGRRTRQGRGGGERQARRQALADDAQQLSYALDRADRVGWGRRDAAIELVEDGQPRRDARPVPREGAAGDRHGEGEAAAALAQALERGLPGGTIGRERLAGDRDEAAARAKPCEGGGHVMPGCGRATIVHVRRNREGRVHQHDGRLDRPVEAVVDGFGVVTRNRDPAEEARQQTGPERDKLVQREARVDEFGEGREEPGAGRGLQHEIFGRDPGREARDIGEG